LGTPEAASEPLVRFYGFADAGVQKLFFRDTVLMRAIVPTTATTFILGNLNFYLDVQPIEHWSALFEVRLTNLPQGVDFGGKPGQPYQRTDTTIYDSNDPSGGFNVIRFGGLILERAYLQYQYNDAFSVRVGSFLTPFGIWNIDHGLPTLIALMVPESMSIELFPTRQLGLEVLGSVHHGAWELGYFGYLSNGRTWGLLALTENKMFGGRLFARTTRPYRLTFGISALAGRYSDQTRATESMFTPLYVSKEIVAFHEQAVGADVSLDIGNLRLRSELSFRRVRYDPGKRDSPWVAGLYTPDHNELEWYGLGAYQLPWFGLEPFIYLEVFHYPLLVGEGAITFSGGLNIHFNPAVQLKFQFAHRAFYQSLSSLRLGDSEQQGYQVVSSRLVLAF